MNDLYVYILCSLFWFIAKWLFVLYFDFESVHQTLDLQPHVHTVTARQPSLLTHVLYIGYL